MLPLKLTVLGSSGARPYVGAPSASIHIQYGSTRLLIDCGEGTQLELEKLKLSPMKLACVCITHMHGDHVYGLPGLLASMALAQRKEPLKLIGPVALEAYVKAVLRFSHAQLTFELQFEVPGQHEHTLYPDLFNNLTVYTIPLQHRIPTSGYCISTKQAAFRLKPDILEKYQIPYSVIPEIKSGKPFVTPQGKSVPNKLLTDPGPSPKRIAYLTDTSLLADWPEHLGAPDVLIHDATFAKEHVLLAKKTGHSTVVQAAAFAKTSGAKRLLLTHVSRRYKSLPSLLEEAKEEFSNTEWAIPGVSLEI